MGAGLFPPPFLFWQVRPVIRAILFDVDDTLYSYQTAHPYGCEAVRSYAVHTLGMDGGDFDVRIQETMAAYWKRMGSNCAAVHNRLIRFQQLLEPAGLPLRHAPIMDRLYWDTLLAHMEPAPGIAEAMDDLKARGLRIGVGTNMTADWQFEKLTRLGLLDRVDFVVSSEEAGVEKPDAGLFLLCAEKAWCSPGECVFVGDSLGHDIAGALSAGMRAVWYRPAAGDGDRVPEGAVVIRSMAELPALADAWCRGGEGQ